jgi:hypothetical protein
MNKALPILLLTGCAAASSAGAQQLYKSVGPDGKVIFSDRPLNNAPNAKVSTMKSYVLRPVETPGQKAPDDKAQVVLQAVPDSAVTPEIEETMLKIMELVDFGRKFEPFCAASEASSKSFAAAHKGWLKRNALYIEHQKRLLMEVVSPTRRAELQKKLAVRVGQGPLKPVGTPAARVEWCNSVVVELNSGHSDIIKPALLAVPLPTYVTK